MINPETIIKNLFIKVCIQKILKTLLKYSVTFGILLTNGSELKEEYLPFSTFVKYQSCKTSDRNYLSNTYNCHLSVCINTLKFYKTNFKLFVKNV